MTIDELRSKYIQFFTGRDHAEISGSSLVPQNDPTVLFTTAGMHPLVPYLLGQEHPAGTRLVDYQKCIRTGDIEEVGDPSHLTFFEMLGNWSLGDYFKEEAIRMSWDFLTSPQWLGLDPARLAVTVFAGDDEVPADEESAEIWRSLGMPDDRIFYLGREHNWWGPAGQTGPCGPDTEMFYDTGRGGPDSTPADSDGRWLEIWNDVFMQYNKTADGRFAPLGRHCVDTGMGVERTVAVLQGKDTVYETEAFTPILDALRDATGHAYGAGTEDVDRSLRIIADHLRTATFILGDEQGVLPSNLGAGYVLRRLIRRAMRHGRKLGLEKPFLADPARVVVERYSHAYPTLAEKLESIVSELTAEEERFLETLRKGEREFAKLLPGMQKNPKRIIPGRIAFRLYDTFGFPIEMTSELAAEHGMSVDTEGFEEAFRKHQEASRSDEKSVFKGGLADHSVMTTRLHTATHLLHQALRDVLGDHVAQKGSNITVQRLRFDFSHPDSMTPEQLTQVEEIVNRQIQADLPVSMNTMTLEDARKSGAIALFGDKYDEVVKVYSIGNYSREVCGGPHVEHTSELGRLRIVKEQSSSAGVRRIKAVLEPAGIA